MINRAFLNYTLFYSEPDENENKLDENDFLSFDIIQLLRSGKSSNLGKCFKNIEKHQAEYHAEFKCIDCNKLYNIKVNKTNLFNLIRNPNICRCLSCDSLNKEKLQREHENEKIKYNLQKEENTANYIKLYLNPLNSFKKETPIKERINCIMNSYLLDDVIADYVNSMTYDDFLRTPYWNGVSYYMKKKANFCCSLCKSNKNLNTHHKDYSQHGYEHLTDIAKNTLIVLCQECHEKFHDII